MIVRALRPEDRDAALAIVDAGAAATRFHARFVEVVECACEPGDPEYAGLVAGPETTITGILVHGLIAGAPGVSRCHFGLSADSASLAALVDEWLSQCREARLRVCELTPDRPFTALRDDLLRHGFSSEARVEGYFAEGVALEILTFGRVADEVVS